MKPGTTCLAVEEGAARNRHAGGFSLIELMITITVVGILTALALPTMQSSVLNNRVKTVTSDFHISLLLARSEAIKRSTDIELEGTGSGWDVKWGTTVLQSNLIDSSITVECNTDADATPETCPSGITFERTGRLEIADIPFEIRFFINGNPRVRMRCVSISLSGRPRALIDTDSVTSNGC